MNGGTPPAPALDITLRLESHAAYLRAIGASVETIMLLEEAKVQIAALRLCCLDNKHDAEAARLEAWAWKKAATI